MSNVNSDKNEAMPMEDKHSFGEKVSSPKFQVQWGLVYVTVYQIISMKSVKILFSCVQFFVTPWTTAHQTTLSMEFSRQEYWGGLPFLTLGDLPNPEIEPVFPVCPALASGFFTTEPPGKLCRSGLFFVGRLLITNLISSLFKSQLSFSIIL